MHAHDHSFVCSHGHDRSAAAGYGRAFRLGVGLNAAFIALEVYFGFFAHSLALLADAGHNATDVIGLLMAWGALEAAKRPPSPRFTYGLQSATIIAALANGLLLLGVAGVLLWEAAMRFLNPVPVGGGTVMAVAAAGIVVNGASALLFAAGRKGDLNIRGAFLHMAADAAVSAGVVVAGAAVMATGWLWLDPLVSLVIGAVIIAGSWGLLREALALSLHGVPPHIDMPALKNHLSGLAGVTDAHDLHVWAMSTDTCALSVHLVMPGGLPGERFYQDTALDLEERFGIRHSSFQIETSKGACACPLTRAHGAFA